MIKKIPLRGGLMVIFSAGSKIYQASRIVLKMDIIALERHSHEELMACLRRVPLLEQPEVLIYEQAL
ncbi:MAG TPA: hypothetical protein VIN67_03325, partial [Desulfobaccales bacterium]